MHIPSLDQWIPFPLAESVTVDSVEPGSNAPFVARKKTKASDEEVEAKKARFPKSYGLTVLQVGDCVKCVDSDSKRAPASFPSPEAACCDRPSKHGERSRTDARITI